MSDNKPDEAMRDLAAQVGMYLQPDPVPNETASMHDLVAADLQTRKEFGYRKYGTILQAGNGRDPLQDAYEEVLDHAVYLKQAIIERQEMRELLKIAAFALPDGDAKWTIEDFLKRTSPPEGFDSGKPIYGTKIHEMYEKYSQIGEKKEDPQEDIWKYDP